MTNKDKKENVLPLEQALFNVITHIKEQQQSTNNNKLNETTKK